MRVQSPCRIRPAANQPTTVMFIVRSLFTTSLLFVALGSVRATTLVNPNVAVVQDFDALASSGTANTALPAGWSFAETGSGANTSYAAGTGSSSTGNTYSFGASGAAERAFGSLRTSSLGSAFGTEVTNGTGGFISSLLVSYLGEQWRLGALGREDRLDFSYSLDATSLTTGTWVDLSALNFIAPVTTGTTGALDGNAAANQALVSATLTGISLSPGSRIWLRWSDVAVTGSNDGLGIDAVSIQGVGAVGPGIPPTASVPDSLPLANMMVMLLGMVAVNSAVRRRSVQA